MKQASNINISESTLIIGHFTEIHGPVQALREFCNKNSKNVVSILHPLPSSPIAYSEYHVLCNGTESKVVRVRSIKQPELFCYVQQLLLSLLLVLSDKRHAKVCIGIDNLNALCAILLQRIGIVHKSIFYVIDYTPKRFNNSLVNILYHFLDNFCAKHSDYVWNISQRISSIRRAQGLANDKNLLVPVGVELGKIENAKQSSIDRYSLAFVSHLEKSKGVELIIEAMTDIVQVVPTAKLEIIGTGPHEEKLKGLVHELRLESFVTFKGLIDHEDLLKYLPTRGIGVATYLNDPNSISYYADPTKPKEYLACGLPVIITKVPWIAEEIENREMGIAINYDKSELVTAVLRLLTDDEFYRICKRNAKAFTSSMSWDLIFQSALRKSGVMFASP
jgi:glycosyltransferase involved in cell wall biosynthesis